MADPTPAAEHVREPLLTDADLHHIRLGCWDGKGIAPALGEKLLDMIAAERRRTTSLIAAAKDVALETARSYDPVPSEVRRAVAGLVAALAAWEAGR